VDVTLPAVVAARGCEYTVKRLNSGANAVTVVAASGETIDGAASYPLNTQWDVVVVYSTGTEWIIL
jgi:hypothetical protein